MKLIGILILAMTMQNQVIFDFTADSSLEDWLVVDDVVMGGRSDGNFFINEDGHGVFRGDVSLENNGGFSSIRYRFPSMDVSNHSVILLRLKGDGKRYQLRVKTSRLDRHSYTINIDTNGEWQEIRVKMNDMKPTFRGMTLRMANYPGEKMSELGFLIGNKKNESFELLIDKIEIETGYKQEKYVWNEKKSGKETA